MCMSVWLCVWEWFEKVARMVTRMATSEIIFSKRYRRASEKKGTIFKSPYAAGMQGCLLGCSKTFRSMWYLLMWYMFLLRIHIIEMLNVWSQPPYVVRVYAIGSFLLKFPFLSVNREMHTRSFFALYTLSLAPSRSFCMKNRSLKNAHSNCRYIWRCFLRILYIRCSRILQEGFSRFFSSCKYYRID